MPWSFRNSAVDGRPAQILIDDRFQASAPVSGLPRLAWFGVYCQSDPGNAFWHPDESDTLDRLENELIKLLDQFGRGWAVYVLRIATRGLREYYVYGTESANLTQVLPKLKAAHPNYRVEYEETSDPGWRRYTSCLPA